MKITVLADNVAKTSGFSAQHGLSLLIETSSRKLLFDMGQDQLFFENAKKLGISLGDVDLAVLSHGHYDHGGGLSCFLRENGTAPVFVNKNAFGDFYNKDKKYIGLDSTLASSRRIRLVGDETSLDENMTLFTCNGESFSHPHTSQGLTKKDGECFLQDDFCHEQYLLISENGKKILISGCSHKGICNLAERFRPDVLIGGFHLSKLDPAQEPHRSELKSIASFLGSFDTEYFTCHCTGMEQYQFLKTHGCSRLSYLACGTETEL